MGSTRASSCCALRRDCRHAARSRAYARSIRAAHTTSITSISTAATSTQRPPRLRTSSRRPIAPRPPAATRIGLVDGGVDATHPVFKDALIHQHGCADKAIPSAHGTAVASLLIGRSERFRGAAPDAQLYTADVYCGLADGGAVDAVVEAISWIAHERVPVINVSLVGPRNVALEGAVRAVIARGFIVVAAVGNDGPAAAPLYPAAYPGVVGVTGVDARQKALRRSVPRSASDLRGAGRRHGGRAARAVVRGSSRHLVRGSDRCGAARRAHARAGRSSCAAAPSQSSPRKPSTSARKASTRPMATDWSAARYGLSRSSRSSALPPPRLLQARRGVKSNRPHAGGPRPAGSFVDREEIADPGRSPLQKAANGSRTRRRRGP